MKKYRKVVMPQPDNHMLLVIYTISECIGNYRLELFNKNIQAKRRIRELRKKRRDIDKGNFF